MRSLIFKTLSLLFMATPVLGFTLGSTNPSQRGWGSKTVTFLYNSANCPAGATALVVKAMDLWNQVSTSGLKVSLGGDSSTSIANLVAGTFTAGVIACDPAFGTTFSTDANAVAGVGQFYTSNGTITKAYVILNAQSGASANVGTMNSDTAAAVVAHELGHALGLGHSSDPNALMYYSLSRITLSLSQDDVDGISFLYPRDELSGDQILGCGSVRNIQDGMKYLLAFMGTLTFLILASMRKLPMVFHKELANRS
jgi:hypothetical protein